MKLNFQPSKIRFQKNVISILSADGLNFYDIKTGKKISGFEIPPNVVDADSIGKEKVLLLVKDNNQMFIKKINLKTGKKIFKKKLKFSIFKTVKVYDDFTVLKSPGILRVFYNKFNNDKKSFLIYCDRAVFNKNRILFYKSGFILVYIYPGKKLHSLYNYKSNSKAFILYKGGLITKMPF